MWPFDQWREERREEREAYLAAIERIQMRANDIVKSALEAVKEVNEVSKEQVQAITSHLEMFKLKKDPESRMTGEIARQRKWLEEQNYPFEGDQSKKVEWLDQRMRNYLDGKSNTAV